MLCSLEKTVERFNVIRKKEKILTSIAGKVSMTPTMVILRTSQMQVLDQSRKDLSMHCLCTQEHLEPKAARLQMLMHKY